MIGRLFSAGDGVVYRPYPGAEGEDGQVVRYSESGLLFVQWSNGPQAGKTTSVAEWQLEPLR